MVYTLPSQEEVSQLAPELAMLRVIRDEENYWYVKYKPGSKDEEKRDRLGYLLGKDFANVAEVRLLSIEEHQLLKDKLLLSYSSNNSNTFLVRVGSDYNVSELKCQSLEKAVATELVYSVWIRRRDTHVDNRVYVDGIPVFYDHHVAFLGDPSNAHSSMFFFNAPDHGHPLHWRVKEITETITTVRARGASLLSERAYHYINNKDIFEKELEAAEEEIRSLSRNNLIPIIMSAGFSNNDAAILEHFLKTNLLTLSADISQMKKKIYMDNEQ